MAENKGEMRRNRYMNSLCCDHGTVQMEVFHLQTDRHQNDGNTPTNGQNPFSKPKNQMKLTIIPLKLQYNRSL